MTGQFTAQELTHEIQRLSLPSLVYDSTDVARAHKLAVVGEVALRNRMEAFLRFHCGGPVAVTYQSDATPEITFQRHDVEVAGRRLQRGGYQTGEYLLDRLFAVAPSGQQCVLFRCPLRLADKTAWTHLQAASQMLLYPWEYGCRSVSITHLVVDGAVFSALRALLHRHHARAVATFCSTLAAGEATIHRLCSWFVASQCVTHGAHNSFKAAMKDNLGDQQLKTMWGIIEGLRTCHTTLMAFARSFVASRIVYRDWSLENGDRMWRMLCFESDIVEKLCHLQLRCKDGAILVAEEFRDDPTVVDQVVDLMTLCFRWRKWTDSRWLSMGDSARSLLTSIILGIEPLIEYAISGGHGPYYLAKAKHMSSEVKQLTVKCAVVSFVADAVLGVLLTDDRLPRMYAAIEQEIESEVQFVQNIPFGVWAFVADVTGLQTLAIRSEAVHGALITAAALRSQYASVLELPWSLCSSASVSDSLDALIAGPEPTEAVTWSVWQLCRAGYSRSEVEEALSLMANLPWSQVSTEQGHSAASVVMKKHRMYGQQMLQTRSMMRQLAVLFNECPEQRKLEQCRKALAKLGRAQPHKLGGRQVFIGQLITVATELQSGQSSEAAIGKLIVARSGERWRALTEEQRNSMRARASVLVAEKLQALEEKTQKAKKAIRAQRDVVEEQRQPGPVRVGACRFTGAEVDLFAAAVSEKSFRGLNLQEYRARLFEAIGPPTLLAQQELMVFDGPQKVDHRPVPDWLEFVAHRRDFFARCIFRLQDTDGSMRYFAFLHAIQAPRIRVAWLPLVADQDAEWFDIALEFHAGAHHPEWQWSFRFSPGEFLWSHLTDEFNGDPDLSVLMDVCYFDGQRLGSSSQWWCWDDIVNMLRTASAKPRAQKSAASDKPALGGALREHPWLQDVFAPAHAGSAHGHGRSGGADQGQASGSGDQAEGVGDGERQLAAVDPDDVFGELMSRRMLWAADHPEPEEHFGTTLRGGAWSAARSGEAVDSVRFFALSAQAKDFCERHQLARTSNFSVRMYGEEVCALLGRVWMARMSFLMDRAASSPGQRLQPAELEGFMPPAGEVADVRARCLSAVNNRLDGILALKPGYMV